MILRRDGCVHHKTTTDSRIQPLEIILLIVAASSYCYRARLACFGSGYKKSDREGGVGGVAWSCPSHEDRSRTAKDTKRHPRRHH